MSRTSVSSPCSDVSLQYGTANTSEMTKTLGHVFPLPLCESNVTIRTQLWQATCPRAYVAFSLFKKPKELQCGSLEKFRWHHCHLCRIWASYKTSTFYWCLFWALEAAGKAGRQLESDENGSAKVLFRYCFLVSSPSEHVYKSFQVPCWNKHSYGPSPYVCIYF